MILSASNPADRIRVLLIVPSLATGCSERVAFNLFKHLNRQIFDVALVSLYPYSGLPYEREAARKGLTVHYLSKRLGYCNVRKVTEVGGQKSKGKGIQSWRSGCVQ